MYGNVARTPAALLDLWGALRQWGFPRELRIAGPVSFPELPTAIGPDVPHPGPPVDPPPPPPPAAADGLDTAFLRALGTDLFRLRRLLSQSATDAPSAEAKIALGRLKALWNACADLGLEILDHTGEDVPPYGEFDLQVMVYKPVPGLAGTQIIETIKPSLLFRGRRIQIGEVIVGGPPPVGVPHS